MKADVFLDSNVILYAAANVQQEAAKTLYSEDLSDGQRYGGVEVVNPFRGLD